MAKGKAYKLALPAHQKFHPVQPISRLEPVRDPRRHPDAVREDLSTPEIQEDGTIEYAVEKIVGKRVVRGRLKYLVQWKGYPEHEQTYEPLEHLENAMDAVREFESYSAQFHALVLDGMMAGCKDSAVDS